MSETELIIEEAKVDDAKALVTFLRGVCEETDLIVASDELLSEDDLVRFIESNLERLNAICLVAKWQDRIIGMANVSSSDDPHFSHVGDLFIAVSQAYSGNGIGHYLMEMICDWAEQSPLMRRLELSVQTRNARAIKLYEDFEFEREGVQKAAVKVNDEYLDILIMSKMIGNENE